MNSLVKICPQGGLGEIGGNCTLIKGEKTNILLDYGILFPKDNTANLSYLLPDLKHIKSIDYILISHAHEDHIGGLPHLCELYPQAPIYCSSFAKAIIEKKKLIQSDRIFEFKNLIEFQLGEYNIKPYEVDHSIPETFSFVVNKKGDNSFCFFWGSDFKINDKNSKFDLKNLSDYSKSFQKRLSFCDSTNICSSLARTHTEDSVYENLRGLISTLKDKRVFITQFSSNLERMQNIIQIGAELNRKVFLYGRSMNTYFKSGIESNYLESDLANLVTDLIDVKEHPPKDSLTIISGCQGDFRSPLNRIANGEDARITLSRDDYFIFSSKAIPGNEINISRIKNQLTQQNAHVHFERNNHIHASGHAGTQDLSVFYNCFKPHHAIPIHGETFFLKQHCLFIESLNLNIKPLLLTNNDSVIVDQHGEPQVDPGENEEFLFFHGDNVQIERENISERKKMAFSGVIFLSLTEDNQYQFSTLGLPNLSKNILARNLERLQKKCLLNKLTDQELKAQVRQPLVKSLGYKPRVEIHKL